MVPYNRRKAFKLNFIVLISNQKKMLSNGDVDWRILVKSIEKGLADQSKRNDVEKHVLD